MSSKLCMAPIRTRRAQKLRDSANLLTELQDSSNPSKKQIYAFNVARHTNPPSRSRKPFSRLQKTVSAYELFWMPRMSSDDFIELRAHLIEEDFKLVHHHRVSSLQLTVEPPFTLLLVSNLPCSVKII